MQSVYKLPIAMAVLDQVERKTLTLNQKVSLSATDMVPVVHSPLRDRPSERRHRRQRARPDPRGARGERRHRLGRAAPPRRRRRARHGLLARPGHPRHGGGDDRARDGARSDGAIPELLDAARGRGRPEGAPRRTRPLSRGAARCCCRTWPTRRPDRSGSRDCCRPARPVAHKTGTDGTRDGKTAATNDIGIVTLPDGRHLAIAVFVKDSTADLVPREAAIAKIAKAAWDHWTAAK